MTSAYSSYPNTGGVATGNLSETGSSVFTITGGTGAVVGAGATIQVKKATGSVDGYLAATDFATFAAKQNALTFGNLSESTSSVLTITGGTGAVVGGAATIQVKQASGSQAGYLSSGDWTTFNGKQSAITTGTTSQYLRGDLSLATLNQAAVAGITTSDSPTFANVTATTALKLSNSGFTATVGSQTLGGNVAFNLPASNGTSGQFLKTDGSGNTSWATPTFIGARVNTCTTSLVNQTNTTLVFTTKDYDTATAYNTTTGVYTIPVAGKYRIHATVLLNSGASGTTWYVDYYILKNGSTIAMQETAGTTTTTTSDMNGMVTTTYSFAVNDTVSVQINQNSGANRTPNASGLYTYFTIEWLGA